VRGFRYVLLAALVGFPACALVVEGVRTGSLRTFADPATYGYLWNSVVLGATAAVFATALAVPFAAAVAFRSFRGRGLAEAAILAPLLVPAHVHAIGWMRVVGRQGLFTEWLADRTGYLYDVRAPWFGNAYAGPAWILACHLFPLVALPLAGALRALDRDALDAARCAGASRLATLRAVVLPAVLPRLGAGAFFVFALAIGSFPVTSLLDTPVLAQRVFFAFSRPEGAGGAALQAVPLLVAAALVAALLPRAATTGGEGGIRAGSARRGGVGAAALSVLPLALSAGPPLYGLIEKVFDAAARRPDAPSPFRVVFAQVRLEFENSLILSVLGAALLVALAWPLAWSLARRPSPRFEALLAGSLALPPVVLGLGVLVGWRAFADVPLLGAVFGSGTALILAAYAARFLPLVVRSLGGAFDAALVAQDDAARVAGAGVLARAFRIVGPAQLGALAAAAALGYVLCFTELDATLMTYGGDLRTVQVRVFNMVHYRGDEEVAALCLLATAFALTPPAIVALLRRPAPQEAA
jgi:iron(III) transport system permease protein